MCSPNMRDIVHSHPRNEEKDETHVAHYQYATVRELHHDFRESFPQLQASLDTFQELKPFYIKPGKQNTCMCSLCENVRLMMKAVRAHTSKFDACFEVMHAAKVIQRFLAACVLVSNSKRCSCCRTKTRRRGWSNARRRKKSELTLVGQVESSPVVSRNAVRIAYLFLSVWAPKSITSLCSLRISQIMRSLVPGFNLHVHEMPRICLRANHTDSQCPRCAKLCGMMRDVVAEAECWDPFESISWTSYYSDKVRGRMDTQLHSHVAHPSAFLDELTALLQKFIPHHYTMKRQAYEHLQLERNFLVDQLLVQVDFSENFVFNVHQNEIQSQHWTSKMATLFYIHRETFGSRCLE